jgi:hypothetical protein
LPDSKTQLKPFELAAAVVEDWLDGAGSAYASRSKNLNPGREVASWDLELEHANLGTQRIRLSIPKDFPATPPQIYFSKSLCLVLPHVEIDGKFCHDIKASPVDYEHPTGAVEAILNTLYKFWIDSTDPAWITSEFHKERLSYWLHYCEQFRKVNSMPTPHSVRVVLQPLKNVAEGMLTTYFRKSQKRRGELMLAMVGDADPHTVASRHGWAVNSLVRGYSLFVPMDKNVRWTPYDWPKTLAELESFVAQITNQDQSVVDWIEDKSDGKPHPFLVVLVQESTCYGFLISPALVPHLTQPGIIPVGIDRVDADWALTRDHQLPVLHTRREKRVLLLGCGSLGSPIAELLTRSGIGEIHLLDKEIFEAENCARHILGLGEVGQPKAHALAKRLHLLMPEVKVKHIRGSASNWIREACKPGTYDIVLDCTGESSVRVMLMHYRLHSLGPCPLVHMWIEPFCAAAHVVYVSSADQWPGDDPGEKLAAARWPEGTQIEIPACGAGFHPYGSADVWQAAGFSTERILAILDGLVTDSTVWSWVRSKAFFKSLKLNVTVGVLVPDSESVFDSIQVTRSLKDILSNE